MKQTPTIAPTSPESESKKQQLLIKNIRNAQKIIFKEMKNLGLDLGYNLTPAILNLKPIGGTIVARYQAVSEEDSVTIDPKNLARLKEGIETRHDLSAKEKQTYTNAIKYNVLVHELLHKASHHSVDLETKRIKLLQSEWTKNSQRHQNSNLTFEDKIHDELEMVRVLEGVTELLANILTYSHYQSKVSRPENLLVYLSGSYRHEKFLLIQTLEVIHKNYVTEAHAYVSKQDILMGLVEYYLNSNQTPEVFTQLGIENVAKYLFDTYEYQDFEAEETAVQEAELIRKFITEITTAGAKTEA